MIHLPNEILRNIISYLNLHSYLALKQTCQYLNILEISDNFWENLLIKELNGNPSFLTLKHGITYQKVVRSLWNDIFIDWKDLLSDSYFYSSSFFLHLNNQQEEVFKDIKRNKRWIKNIMSEDSFLNLYDEYEIITELFESNSDIYSFCIGLTSLIFTLPGENNSLKMIIGSQVSLISFYFLSFISYRDFILC